MKQILLILFLGFFCCAIKAQLSTEEIPYSWVRGSGEIMKQAIPLETLPHLDMETIDKEDLERESLSVPFRFGFSHDVKFDLSNSGVWTTTADGGRLWNLRIYSPDALSLNLLYDKFWLPDSAKFFIYSEDKTQHIGAFTSTNNQGNRDSIMGFATGFLFTNSIVLEYYEPKETKESGIISISQVISGYRYLYDMVRDEEQTRINHPLLLPCHNDVTCVAGNGHVNERNAVALIVMGGQACSGALLNTTANDNRPVFLSANHCFTGTSVNLNQWMFVWNYEAPCGGVVNEDPNRTTIGADLLARNANSDFLLLNLIEHPAMNSNINLFFLGWDRTTTAATRGASIHHPRGSQKKISLTTNSLTNYASSICWDYDPFTGICMGGTTPANTHWRVAFTNGTVERGSSGAPFLNQNNLVIGQLHGGDIACPPNPNNSVFFFYGRFDVSWTGGGTSTTRLSDWLNPLGGTAPTALNGKGCDITLNNRTYNSGSHLLAGCTIEISNTTIEQNTTVRIHGQESVTLKPGFHAKAGSNVRITAGGGIVSRVTGDSIDYEDTISVSMLKSLMLAVETTEITNETDFIVYPNPTNGDFQIKITGNLQPYTMEMFNSSGNLLGRTDCDMETVNVNRNDLPVGIYYIRLVSNGKQSVKKLIIQ